LIDDAIIVKASHRGGTAAAEERREGGTDRRSFVGGGERQRRDETKHQLDIERGRRERDAEEVLEDLRKECEWLQGS
jgi:hypothetical protein